MRDSSTAADLEHRAWKPKKRHGRWDYLTFYAPCSVGSRRRINILGPRIKGRLPFRVASLA